MESKTACEYESFSSSQSQLLVGEQKYVVRILKMNGSTMVFLSAAEPECLDEIAMAMKIPQDKQVIGTYILGPQIVSDSQLMAEKLCRRFGRHFIVSYNVQVDRMTAPLLEKELSEFIRAHEYHKIIEGGPHGPDLLTTSWALAFGAEVIMSISSGNDHLN